MFRFLSIPGNWVRGVEPSLINSAIDTSGWAIPWALIALGAARWWAWRKHWRNELVLCGIAGALVVSGAIAASTSHHFDSQRVRLEQSQH